jgi:hypothetical protein
MHGWEVEINMNTLSSQKYELDGILNNLVDKINNPFTS